MAALAQPAVVAQQSPEQQLQVHLAVLPPAAKVCHVLLVARTLQGLPQLEPAIMDKLLWPSVPMLTSVHQQEEVARRARDALSGCIIASLTPLRR